MADTFDNPVHGTGGGGAKHKGHRAMHRYAVSQQYSRLKYIGENAGKGGAKREEELVEKEQLIEDLKTLVKKQKEGLLEAAIAEENKRNGLVIDEPEQHDSGNTIRDLESGIERYKPTSKITFVWALVFRLPPIEYKHGVLLDPMERIIPHEVWSLCYRLWACDLHVRYHITMDNQDIILEIGATHELLVMTAHELQIGMRMQVTRGSLPFHEDLVEFMAYNHAGLNEWDEEKRRWKVRGGDASAQFMDGHLHSMERDKLIEALVDKGVPQHVAKEMDKDALKSKLSDMRDAFDHEQELKRREMIWMSSTRQRLVRYRAKKYAGIDFELRMQAPSPEACLESLEDKLEDKKEVRSIYLHQLLTAVGGYRPSAEHVFPRRTDENGSETCYTHKLAQQFLIEPNFVIRKDEEGEQNMTARMKSARIAPVTYKELGFVWNDLKAWRDKKTGKGRKEQFVGSLTKYYATHDYNELEYLRQQWGNFGLLLTPQLSAYAEDGNPRDQYSLSHPDNQVHEYTIPWTWAWQPIHEIRDYFGDNTALYYAWLGHYTASLFICMLFGLLTMVVQWTSYSVENNPLTSAYSFYVGMWSVTFVEAWNRKECEFQFLWGNEELEGGDEGVRPQFVGKLTVTETGREMYVHISKVSKYLKVTTAFLIVWLMICFTVVSALGASLIRAIPHPGQDGYEDFWGESPGPMFEKDGELEGGCAAHIAAGEKYHFIDHPCGFWQQNKWLLCSSFVNLIIIQTYGAIYEILAQKLNEWENHRTHADFDNSLVVKNFMFQFLNNYFLLFYIAFFRECETSSCLPELQEQLVVVFTGKTIFKQMAHSGKPFIRRCLNQRREKAERAQFQRDERRRKELAPGYIPVTAHERQEEEKARLAEMPPVEVEANLIAYEGTFDDFNDRVVQFGYLVLFAPAYPLAPLLAWLNNILEIRFGGYKMCRGYQRPVWQKRDTIGSWLGTLSFLGFAAVITNAAMIFFVGGQQADSYDLNFEVDLVKKELSTIPRDSLQPVGTFMTRLNHAHLWWNFVFVEHAIMILRVVIMQLVPTVPVWVEEARETLTYRRANVYLTKGDIDARNRQNKKIAENMDSGDLRMLDHSHTGKESPSNRWSKHSVTDFAVT